MKTNNTDGVRVDALPEPYAYEVQWAEAGSDCSRAEFRVLPPRDPDRYEKVTRLYTDAQVRALLGTDGVNGRDDQTQEAKD